LNRAFTYLSFLDTHLCSERKGDPVLWASIESQVSVVEKEKLSDIAKRYAKDIHVYWDTKRRAKGKPLTPLLKACSTFLATPLPLSRFFISF
jgi:hypothetical protein